MANLYNIATQQYEPIPDDEVTKRVASGQFVFAKGAMVPVRLPNGEKYEVEPEHAAQAFGLGATFITAQQERDDELRQEYGSGWGNALGAFALGALSGASLSTSNLALVESGIINKETLDALKKHQTGAYYSGDVTGSIGMVALSGGLGGTAQVGLRAGAGTARGLAAWMPAALTARGAAAAGRGVTELALKGGTGIARMKGARALGAATEGALDAGAFAAAETITEGMMGNPNVNAETLITNVGLSMVLGGALSAAIPGLGTAFFASKDKMMEGITNIYRKKFGSDIQNPTAAHKAVAEALSLQEGIPLDEALRRTEMAVDVAKKRAGAEDDLIQYRFKLADLESQAQKLDTERRNLNAAWNENDILAQRMIDDYGKGLELRVQRLEKIDAESAKDAVDELLEFEKLDLAEKYNHIQLKLDSQQKIAKQTLDELQGDYDNAVKQLQAEGKIQEGTYTAEHIHMFDPDNPYSAPNNLQEFDNQVEALQKLMMGQNRTDALVDLIDNGVDAGTHASDVIDQAYGLIATMRDRLAAKIDDRLYASPEDIRKVNELIDSLETRVNETVAKVGKFERKTPTVTGEVAYEKVVQFDPKKNAIVETMVPIESAPKAQREGVINALSEDVRSKVTLNPDLDKELKRALFPILDDIRKDLGAVIFGKQADETLQWNTRSLLRQVWEEVSALQRNKAFGEAGETLGRLNDTWSELIEARKNFQRKFRGTTEVEGHRQVAVSKVKRWFNQAGRPAVKAEFREADDVLDRYMGVSQRLAAEGGQLGLVGGDFAERLQVSFNGIVDTREFATEMNQVFDLVGDLTGRSRKPSGLPHDERARTIAEDIFHRADSVSDLGRLKDDYLETSKSSQAELLEQEASLARMKDENAADIASQTRDRELSKLERAPAREGIQNEIDFLQNQLDEVRGVKGEEALKNRAEVGQIEASLAKLREEALMEPAPDIYRPTLPKELIGAEGDLQTHGTTSPMGLLGFSMMGWQGAAVSTMGFSSILKRLRNVTNDRQRYLALMDLHDSMVMYQEKRRTMIKKAVEGKLDRYMARKRPSAFSVLLASTAKIADFGQLLDAQSTTEFGKAADKLNGIEANPALKAQLLENAVKPLEAIAPDTAKATMMKLSNSLSYLHSVLPQEPVQELLRVKRQPYEPPDSEKFRFARDVDMVEDWFSTVEEGLATKTLMSHQVDTMKQCHPESYQSCMVDALEYIQRLDKPMDADTTSVMAIFLGPQIDPTRQPKFISTISQSFVPGQPVQPNPSAAALKKVPQSYATPSQNRMA